MRQARRFSVSLAAQYKEYPPCLIAQTLPEGLREGMLQPFFFLGEGRQTLVFESADGSLVLKLFKHARTKKKKLKDSFLGACLASTKLPEETGLLFFAPTGISESLSLTLLTKKGKVASLDLSQTSFLLQKKAQNLKERLLCLKSKNDLASAKECIRSIFKLLASCREKHVADRDGALIRNGNLGCIEDRVILIDTGKLVELADREKQTLHDLNRLRPFVSWCKEAYPELLPTLGACEKEYGVQANALTEDTGGHAAADTLPQR